MSKKVGKWISVLEAVKILGLSEKTIRRRIKSGRMTSKKVGRHYLVFISDEKEKTETNETPEQDDTRIDENTKVDHVLLKTIIDQLKEKDEQIKRLDDRLKENQILLLEFRRLLPAPEKENSEETAEEFTVVEQDKKTSKGRDKRKINIRLFLYLIGAVAFGLFVYGLLTYLNIPVH